jgi:hypothetical protein
VRNLDLISRPEQTMQATTEHSRASQVTALFADGALSFDLPKGATLGDLAERLAYLRGHRLSTVTIKLNS